MISNDKMLRYDAAKKSQGVAFILWWLLGIFGGHRFYMKQTGTAVAQLILAITVIGWPVLIIWLFVDLFLIWGMVNRYNDEVLRRIRYEPEWHS